VAICYGGGDAANDYSEISPYRTNQHGISCHRGPERQNHRTPDVIDEATPNGGQTTRYATRTSRKSQEYFRYDLYGCPDGVRNGDRTILVDCGFDKERGMVKKRVQQTAPLEILARMGVGPADIDHVVISHMHYDHVGNVSLFPNATFGIARDEYEFWSGPYGSRELDAGHRQS